MALLHELTKELKPLHQQKFLLAVSGGGDSMALLYIFLHFRQHFAFDFSVAHFHHGPTESEAQAGFRLKAWKLVKDTCQKNSVEFYSNFTGENLDEFLKGFTYILDNEDKCRQARYQWFESLLSEHNFDHLVLAHHREDLLETRLMRMIRGVGPERLVSMEKQEGYRLRPLLEQPRQVLLDYLKESGGDFVEDPSNSDLKPLRNWVRGFWLPELEKKIPGGCQSLARSIDLMAQNANDDQLVNRAEDPEGLDLSYFWTLSVPQQRQLLACYMRSQGLKNYGLSHINEVVKRLDNEKKSHSFKLLGRCWKVDAGRMSLG